VFYTDRNTGVFSPFRSYRVIKSIIFRAQNESVASREFEFTDGPVNVVAETAAALLRRVG